MPLKQSDDLLFGFLVSGSIFGTVKGKCRLFYDFLVDKIIKRGYKRNPI